MPTKKSRRRYIGIDPGSKHCAIVDFQPPTKFHAHFTKVPSRIHSHFMGTPKEAEKFLESMITELTIASMSGEEPLIIIEKPTPHQIVPTSLIDTAIWMGRVQCVCDINEIDNDVIKPQEIKKILCGTARAKDKDRRQSLINLLGDTKKGSLLNGITSHRWAALSVAVAYWMKDEGLDLKTLLEVSPL